MTPWASVAVITSGPFLLQTYRRDTGEIMHDISAPVMVKGRQWGGFRIGYKTEV